MRYNIFNQVHKALRALLYDEALTIQQTDGENTEEATAALSKLKLLIELFEEHALHEDEHILPIIEPHAPDLIDVFEHEHVAGHTLGCKLKELMNMFEKSNNKTETLRQLYVTYAEFMCFNLRHMAKEEDLLNNVLWKHYDDASIMQIAQQIVSGIPAEKNALYAKWMFRGISNNEIIRWLHLVQKSGPAVTFGSLLAIAETELPAGRWQQIQERIIEGKMVSSDQ